jgi:hypothetical protein
MERAHVVAMLNNGASRSFNGDGKPDLLVRERGSGDVLVYPHSGALDGLSTFLQPILIKRDMGWRNVAFIRSLDNGSGRADILAFDLAEINPGVAGEHGLFLFPNTGGLNGLDTLGEPMRISGKRDDGQLWETVGMADISGNGADDTFSRGWDAGNVDWFPHTGRVLRDDTYDKTPHRLTEVAVDDFPLAMADFTGNGRLDLLVLRAGGDLDLFVFDAGHDLTTSREAGQGTWYRLAGDWKRFQRTTLSDVDCDGNPDLLVVDEGGRLLAFRHRGKFSPENPSAVLEEPVVVGEGFAQYDVVC